jgi:hypothetical protein
MWTVRRLWRALIALAFTACVASLFGPAAPWWGVDIGAVGSNVFHLAVIASTVVAAMRPREIFPEEMAIAECRAWVGCVFTAMILLGFAKYLAMLAHLEAVPTNFHDLPFRHFQVLLVTLFIAWGVTSGVLAHGAGAIESDERDLRLRHAADRDGDWALTFIVIGCVVLLMAVPAQRLDWWLEPIILANVLIGVLVVKVQVESVALVTRYAQTRR